MKKIIAGFLAAFFILLCGCAKTPDEVKTTMRSYNSDQGNVKASDFEYSSASEILKNENEVFQRKYQNLTMPSKLSIRPVSSIPVVTFRQTSGFEKSYQTVMSLFFDKATLAHQKIEYTANDIYSNRYWFLNPSEKISATVCSNGLVLVRKKDAFDVGFNDIEYERVKLIHVDRGENTNISYRLLDKKYSISDAVNYVDQWLSEKWMPFEPGFTFRVKTVQVRKLDWSHYYYQMTVEQQYKGIPLDELADLGTAYDKDHRFYPIRTQRYLSVEMMTSGTISAFNGGYGILGTVKEDVSASRYVTLKSAADKVEEKLSGFKNIRISDVYLKYTLCPIYDHTVIYEDKAKTKGFRKQTIDSPGITVTSRPVYAFIIDVDPKEYEKKDGRVYEGDARKYVYVDAVTGALELRMDYRATLGA